MKDQTIKVCSFGFEIGFENCNDAAIMHMCWDFVVTTLQQDFQPKPPQPVEIGPGNHGQGNHRNSARSG